MLQLLTPTLLILLSIGIAWRLTPDRSIAWLASLTFLVLMLVNGMYYAADYFTGNGIDESVLFHMRVGLAGSGVSEYLGLIFSMALYVTASAVGAWLLHRSVISRPAGRSRVGTSAIAVLTATAFLLHPATLDLYQLSSSALASPSADMNIEEFPEEFVTPDTTIADPKNIVYLYLEGLERTYLDETLFPALMPNISELEESGISFTEISQVTHTGWTIAGMVASQCGIPLYSPSDGNSLSGLDRFLPQAHCLGDILGDNGYSLSFMGGADIDFAGKGNFYRTHGFDSVRGRDELSNRLDDPEYQSGWGLYDDTLFSLIKEEYLALKEKEAPFALFSLTLDTHHPEGHVSHACENIEYGDGSNPMLNSVHCADLLVKDLVDFIRDNPGENGTVLVITSDHYALNNTASAILESGYRRNLALMIDTLGNRAPRKIDRSGSMLDMAPTILSLLGSDVEGLGFGRNLLSDSPTLAEREAHFDGFLNENRNVVRYLWDYPQLHDGIQHYSERENQLSFGERRITMPALLMLENGGRVNEIVFAHSGQRRITDYIAEMSPGQNFLWADRCDVLTVFSDHSTTTDSSQARWCAAAGTAGGPVQLWEADNSYISRDRILETLSSDTDLSITDHRQRLTRISDYMEYGVSPAATVGISSDDSMTGTRFIKSSGFGAGDSFIDKDGTRVRFSRGLTLVGLSEAGFPLKLAHIDSCDGTVTDSGALQTTGDFRSVMESLAGTMDTFVIVGHDSVICTDPDNLENYLNGLDLQLWQDIGFREPYIAILPVDGDNTEWIGDREEAIAIRVDGFAPDQETVPQRRRESIPRIAHAGGGIDGMTYTNSIDALERNRDRYSLFEIDFSWTRDGHLVCLHDWNESFQRSFGSNTDEPLSRDEFRTLAAEQGPVRKCTLESLVEWMGEHPGKRIVTDVKERNIAALRYIAEHYPRLQDRFVPQVYQPDEYHAARLLGYDDIIWTLYKYTGDRQAVLAALEHMDLYALTMPTGRVESGVAEAAYEKRQVLSYVHTINSEEAFREFSMQGIAEIYTDWLYPDG